MATVQNFTLDQGSYFYRKLSFALDTVPTNLTGYTFRGQARRNYGDKNAAFTFSFTVLNQGTNPGEVDWKIEATETEGLKLTESTVFVYDIERVNPSGKPERILQGTFTVSPEATKNE